MKALRGSNGALGNTSGPSRPSPRTISPPAIDSAELVAITGAQASPPRPLIRCGSAEPKAKAPTITPRARPRSRSNQAAMAFIAGGYTRARHTPVARRTAIAVPGVCTPNKPRLARPAAILPSAIRRRGFTRSARFSVAEISAPATKPSCTAIVSQAPQPGARCQAFCSSGRTAVADSQGAMPSNMPVASTPRASQRPAGGEALDRCLMGARCLTSRENHA